MFRERNEAYMLSFTFIDTVVAFVSFFLAFALRFHIISNSQIKFFSLAYRGYLFIGIVITVSQLIVFYFLGMYQPRKVGFPKKELGSIVLGTSITIAITLGAIFFLKTLIAKTGYSSFISHFMNTQIPIAPNNIIKIPEFMGKREKPYIINSIARQ